jgi:hypothetical protein
MLGMLLPNERTINFTTRLHDFSALWENRGKIDYQYSHLKRIITISLDIFSICNRQQSAGSKQRTTDNGQQASFFIGVFNDRQRHTQRIS